MPKEPLTLASVVRDRRKAEALQLFGLLFDLIVPPIVDNLPDSSGAPTEPEDLSLVKARVMRALKRTP